MTIRDDDTLTKQQPKFSARDDAERLKSVGRGMSYNDASEAVWKHTLMEIAMRLETGGYASPPYEATPLASQRSVKPWMGLTHQDIHIAFDDTQEGGGFDEFARAIEAKLKEKNA